MFQFLSTIKGIRRPGAVKVCLMLLLLLAIKGAIALFIWINLSHLFNWFNLAGSNSVPLIAILAASLFVIFKIALLPGAALAYIKIKTDQKKNSSTNSK